MPIGLEEKYIGVYPQHYEQGETLCQQILEMLPKAKALKKWEREKTRLFVLSTRENMRKWKSATPPQIERLIQIKKETEAWIKFSL